MQIKSVLQKARAQFSETQPETPYSMEDRAHQEAKVQFQNNNPENPIREVDWLQQALHYATD